MGVLLDETISSNMGKLFSAKTGHQHMSGIGHVCEAVTLWPALATTVYEREAQKCTFGT